MYSNRSLYDSFKLRRSGMVPTPRHHAAPMGLAAVLFGVACYTHVVPTELPAIGSTPSPSNPGGIGLAVCRIADL